MRFSIVCIALCLSTPAAAITVDFNELIGDSNYLSPLNSYVSQGYQFTNSVSAPGAFLGWGRNDNLGNSFVYNADANPATGTTLGTNYGNSITTVRRLDGAAFTLSSLFVADSFNTGTPGSGTPVVYSFTTAAGTTSVTRNLDQIRGLQAEVFNLGGLLSFSIAPQQYQPDVRSFPIAGFIQIDNVGLTRDMSGGVGGVPEPASWAMLIAGFGLTGAAMRRRAHFTSPLKG